MGLKSPKFDEIQQSFDVKLFCFLGFFLVVRVAVELAKVD